ncbi:MAG: calcium/sodium antiporter [Fibrobacteres bacterium]|nr:calcium/sodium antiporter [Fibrobacterota bacterium]
MMVLFLLVGLVLLYFGAEWLVKGSSRFALRHGVSSLVVGLTIVAFGTSAPELVVSVRSALSGFGNIAVGNVVGSNIFNIAAILGISAIICPLKVHIKVIRLDMPIVLAASMLLVFFLRNGAIERFEALILLAGIIVYTVTTIKLGKRESVELAIPQVDKSAGKVNGSNFADAGFTFLGLGLLIVGSQLFVKGAVDLARMMSISDAVIGLTIVAAGTSLPELATSIVAAIKGEQDIAVGNIVGSNIFNILAIIGISGTITPLDASGIGNVDLLIMAVMAAVLIPLMKTGLKISRGEGSFLLVSYCAYVWHLWPV